MKLLPIFLLLANIASAQLIGESYTKCQEALVKCQYEILSVKDTLFATHKLIKTRVVLVFENDTCFQNIEYHAYPLLADYMKTTRRDWTLKGQLESGGFLYEKDSLYMAVEFQAGYFTANILSRNAYLSD